MFPTAPTGPRPPTTVGADDPRKVWAKMQRITDNEDKVIVPTGVVDGLGPAMGPELRPEALQAAVDAAYAQFKDCDEGKVANYIPILGQADPKLFGICLVTPDGRSFTAGNVTQQVSMQSVSKVFTMALVMQQHGPQIIKDNLGVDATGQAFNSIKAIEEKQGLGMNPLVNAGAIATTSFIEGPGRERMWEQIIAFVSACAGRPLTHMEDVYESETKTGARNRAIGALMDSYGRLRHDPAETVDLYIKQCAIGVNVLDLGQMAATLALGWNPVTKVNLIHSYNLPKILAVMATAGLYDQSGQWLFECGLPAKSGVGGGIIAVAPGKFGVAAISPPLDSAGNSVRAIKAISYITKVLDANPYAPPRGLPTPAVTLSAPTLEAVPVVAPVEPADPAAIKRLPPVVRQRFEEIDAGKTGKLSIEDLQGVMTGLGERLTAEEARAIMEHADIDRDGELSFEEFAGVAIQYKLFGIA